MPVLSPTSLPFACEQRSDSVLYVESKSGRLVWEAKLPAPAHANPISYQGKNGKQYIVVQAGHELVAYSLP